MPEGPEIRRAADMLAKSIAGRRAAFVEFAFPHLAADGIALGGRRVKAVDARGKAMLTHFEGGRTIYSHNQLYGEWAVLSPGEPPQATKQIRLAIHTAQAIAVLYSASEISVWNTADLFRHPYLAKLGVELLAPRTTLDDVKRQVESPRFARARLAALLLDQGFLCGLGNYLRSEILFVAGIHPDARIARLGPQQRRRLATAALTLTRRSYRTAGITNGAQNVRRLRAAGWAFEDYRFLVFDREGQPCYTCGGGILRRNVSGRGLFWCPACQRAGA